VLESSENTGISRVRDRKWELSTLDWYPVEVQPEMTVDVAFAGSNVLGPSQAMRILDNRIDIAKGWILFIFYRY
jgi:hypothetical protein